MNTVTSKDGTKIAFDKTGDGLAVILVGGAMRCRAMDPSMAKFAEEMEKTIGERPDAPKERRGGWSGERTRRQK